MKTIGLFLLALLNFQISFSQESTVNPSDKVILTKGEIIKISTNMSSENTQSMMGGDPTEMKTMSKTYTEYEVKELTSYGYLLSKTLKKMSLDFDGFGQVTSYDSEKEAKTDNPFVKPFAEKIGISEDVKLGFDGKMIEEEGKDKKGGKGKGKGMGRMMGAGNMTSVNSAFQLIPKSAIEKMEWEETKEEEGLKTRRRYKIGGMMGNLAKLYVQAQTKGDIEIIQGGMSIITNVNVISEEVIIVNMETGKVQMQTINSTTNNKVFMNDKESPATGTTAVTITVE